MGRKYRLTILFAIAGAVLISDIAINVDHPSTPAILTTLGILGGASVVLVGFLVVSDVTTSRFHKREMAIMGEMNRTLEERVQQRTQELVAANQRLVETQEQLLRNEKLAAIGQLAGGVAHDLRNPLGAINNAVHYLNRRLGASDLVQSNPRIGQFIHIIEDEVKHSNQIITDLTTFARVNPPRPSETNLEEVIESALANMETGEDIRLAKHIDPAVPDVWADGEQLQRVFANLVLNAKEAMPDGGDITVSLRRVGEFAEVSFGDTGIGVKEENAKKIFEPLFTTKSRGTGLGLAICQQMVSRHHGTIDVVSKKGEGSTFTVRLPIDGVRHEEV